MSNHQQIVDEQWRKFLKQDDIKGGNLYFFQGGKCVGHIKDFMIRGDKVRFYFAWSGRTSSRGWVRRNYKHYDVVKLSLRDAERGKPVRLGSNTVLYWANALELNESNLVAPTSRSESKGAKTPKPLPLFDR